MGLGQILEERRRVGEETGKKAEVWFQLYVARDRVATEEKIREAVRCVVTSPLLAEVDGANGR